MAGTVDNLFGCSPADAGSDCRASPLEADASSQSGIFNAGGWIEWQGGKCPVPWDTKVQVRMRDGQTERVHPAGYWMRTHDDRCYWQHDPNDHNSDIVAYRVVSPDPAVRS